MQPQMRSSRCPSAPLDHGIMNILLMSSEKEMVGVNARWIVTSVTNIHPTVDETFMDLKRKAMRPHERPVNTNNAISIWRTNRSRPKPTPTVWFRGAHALKPLCKSRGHMELAPLAGDDRGCANATP